MHRLLLVLFVLVPIATAGAFSPPLAGQQVPDEMPFDVPYGESIDAGAAAQVVDAVIAEARSGARDWKLAIAVTDPAGDLVYFHRMDGTQAASNQIAMGKARTAARFRRPTQVFFEAMQEVGGSIISTLDPTLIASPGGIPLVRDGRVIGAVGCSGATGGQDHVACEAGVAVIE